MSDKDYPYPAWVLTPSFKTIEVTIVCKKAYSFGSTYLKTESGKEYLRSEVHQTKQAAIAAGRAALDGQQAALDKKQANIIKRRAALDKAESP